MRHDPPPGIADNAILADGLSPAGKIAHIKRYQRQHAWREKAEDALQKHGGSRNTGADGKTHEELLSF